MSRKKKTQKRSAEDVAFFNEFVAPELSKLLGSMDGWKPPELPELTEEDLKYMSPKREEELHQQMLKMRNR